MPACRTSSIEKTAGGSNTATVSAAMSAVRAAPSGVLASCAVSAVSFFALAPTMLPPRISAISPVSAPMLNIMPARLALIAGSNPPVNRQNR